MQAEEDEREQAGGKRRGQEAGARGSKGSCLCQMSPPGKRAPALRKPWVAQSKAHTMAERSKEASKAPPSQDIFFKGELTS